MTPAQFATFKAAILADGTQTANVAAGNHGAIAAAYNAPVGGTIWKPAISIAELNTAIVWSEFAGLTVALQQTYLAMIQSGTVDATSANLRGGFTAVFTGKTSLTNLTTLAARAPTKFEALFTNNNVSTVFGYAVTVADVATALGG